MFVVMVLRYWLCEGWIKFEKVEFFVVDVV